MTVVVDVVVALKALVVLHLDVDALLTLNGGVITVHACALLIVDLLVVRVSPSALWVVGRKLIHNPPPSLLENLPYYQVDRRCTYRT